MFLVYLLVVLAIAGWGGVVVGSAWGSSRRASRTIYFVKPLHTLEVARPDDVVALVASWSSR